MKYLKFTFYGIASITIAIIVLGLVFANIYGDEIKAYVVKEINKSLNVQISVHDVSFSVLKRFPYATVQFEDVSATSASPVGKSPSEKLWKEQLFYAKNIYLKFNIIDLLQKKYLVQKIEINEAKINLLVDKNGQDNFHFWKSDSLNKYSDSSTFDLELKEVLLLKTQLNYSNVELRVDAKVNIENCETALTVVKGNYSLNLDAQFYIDTLMKAGEVILTNKNAQLLVNAELIENKKLLLRSSELSVAKIQSKVLGEIRFEKKYTYYNLKAKITPAEINYFLAFLPDKHQNIMANYRCNGQIGGTVDFVGELSARKFPLVQLLLNAKDGKIAESKSGVEFESIFFNALFTNNRKRSPENFHLIVSDFSTKSEQGSISGNFNLQNFENPFAQANVNAEVDLEKIQQFFQIDTLKNLHGKVNANITFVGLLKKLNGYSKEEITNLNIIGKLQLTDVGTQLKSSKYEFSDISGTLQFNTKDVTIDSLRGRMKTSDFTLNGSLKNLLPYFLSSNELLQIDASMYSSNIKLDDFIISTTSTTNDTSFQFAFSDKIKSNLKLNVKQLSFLKFNAQNIKGTFQLDNKIAQLNDLSFKAMRGTVSGRCVIDGTDSNYIQVLCDVQTKRLDVRQLFYEFDNFGQQTLQDKNLNGFATAKIMFASMWTNKLEVLPEKITSNIELEIEQGELIEFKPLLSLSKFISVAELTNIKFATLKNTIQIVNQTTYIPEMLINSSTLKILFSGSHTFENVIDYHIKLSLNELLTKKARRNKLENNEFGVVDDDGLGKINLFVKMTGTTDNPVISYDRKGLKTKYKNDATIEKQEIKQLLNKEFGWFKKQELNVHENKTEDREIEMEWEEPTPATNEKAKKTVETKKIEQKKIKILDKISDDKKNKKIENSDDFN